MDIEGGVAIVTGSSSGVGAACARQLAERGCHVAINYSRNEDGARQTEAACEEFGVETVWFRPTLPTTPRAVRWLGRIRVYPAAPLGGDVAALLAGPAQANQLFGVVAAVDRVQWRVPQEAAEV